MCVWAISDPRIIPKKQNFKELEALGAETEAIETPWRAFDYFNCFRVEISGRIMD